MARYRRPMAIRRAVKNINSQTYPRKRDCAVGRQLVRLAYRPGNGRYVIRNKLK